jgi:hypothetical protein
MKGEHLLAFGLGLLVGWLVLPMVIGMVSGGAKTA